MWNLRHRKVINYCEQDELPYDHYVYCEKCTDYVYEYCSIHGQLLIVPDDIVPTKSPISLNTPRAALTVPHVFLHIAPSTISDAGLGVFSTLVIPSGVRFGPYKGALARHIGSGYCWQIYDASHRASHVIDAQDANNSNWMRYVNCARHCTEQNLIAYQYKGQLYYRTIKAVPRFSELLVFYGCEYANSLRVDLRSYNSGICCQEKNVHTNKQQSNTPIEKMSSNPRQDNVPNVMEIDSETSENTIFVEESNNLDDYIKDNESVNDGIEEITSDNDYTNNQYNRDKPNSPELSLNTQYSLINDNEFDKPKITNNNINDFHLFDVFNNITNRFNLTSTNKGNILPINDNAKSIDSIKSFNTDKDNTYLHSLHNNNSRFNEEFDNAINKTTKDTNDKENFVHSLKIFEINSSNSSNTKNSYNKEPSAPILNDSIILNNSVNDTEASSQAYSLNFFDNNIEITQENNKYLQDHHNNYIDLHKREINRVVNSTNIKNNSKTWTCKYCNRVLSTNTKKSHHYLTHNICPICSYTNPSKHEFYKHETMHRNSNNLSEKYSFKYWQCDVCMEILSFNTNVRIHARSHKTDKYKPIGCINKDRTKLDNNYADLSAEIDKIPNDKDQREHTNTKLEDDEICNTDNLYNTSPELNVSDNNLTNNRNKSEVVVNKSVKMAEISNEVVNVTQEVKKRTWQCDICRKMVLKSNASKHKITHAGRRVFRCNVCDFICNYPSDLLEHSKIH